MLTRRAYRDEGPQLIIRRLWGHVGMSARVSGRAGPTEEFARELGHGRSGVWYSWYWSEGWTMTSGVGIRISIFSRGALLSRHSSSITSHKPYRVVFYLAWRGRDPTHTTWSPQGGGADFYPDGCLGKFSAHREGGHVMLRDTLSNANAM